MVNLEVQSILFDRRLFSSQQAMDWLLPHHFRVYKLDITKKYLRFRQFPPNRNLYRYRTKQIKNGIKFILLSKKKIMSVFSNPLVYDSVLFSLENEPSPTIISEKVLNPEMTLKQGSQTPSANNTITYEQYRYIIAYGQVSIFLYLFQNINYDNYIVATTSNPITFALPLPEFSTAEPGDVLSNTLSHADAIISSTTSTQVGENPPDQPISNIAAIEMYGPGFTPSIGGTYPSSGYGVLMSVTGVLSNESFSVLLFYLNTPTLELPEPLA
jgi:hypothetical protein